MGHWSPGLWAEVTYFSASGDSDTIVVSCPLKDFYFPVVKMSKNTLIQESESKRNTDFLAPGTLVYESTLNTSQVLVPKKRLESQPSLFLGLRHVRFFWGGFQN